MMSFLNKFNSIIFKIVQIMDKLNKFSNQMEGSGSSSDYSKEETKRKGKQKKQKSKNKIEVLVSYTYRKFAKSLI